MTMTLLRDQRAADSQVVPSVAPSLVPGTLPDFVDDSSFGVFGSWASSAPVYMPYPAAEEKLARWIALDGPKGLRPRDLWARVQKANPWAFKEFRLLRLFDSSLNLPAEPVVFSVIADPTQLSDEPPEEVHERYLQAIEEHPCARFFQLEPNFRETESGELELVSFEQLKEQHSETIARIAKRAGRWGWWYHLDEVRRRIERWAEARQRERARRRAEREMSRPRYNRLLARMARRARQRGLLGAARILMAESLGYKTVDPILVFNDPELDGSKRTLRLVAHWDWEGGVRNRDRKLQLHI